MLECRAEWARLTKWDEKVSYVQSAKGEIESFRVGKARWGIALFPLNCGLESFNGLAVLPEVCVSVCMSVCMSMHVVSK